MERKEATLGRRKAEKLCDNMWHIVASIGDAIDNERIHTDRQWKLYANELHEWIISLLVAYQESE